MNRDLSCRFRHLPINPGMPARCLHHRIFARERIVTPEFCAACDRCSPFAPAAFEPAFWPSTDRRFDLPAARQRNCLLVLQPRNIARCLESIEALPVDKVFFRAFSEHQLVVPLNDYIQRTSYDNYLIVADDVIVSRQAYDIVSDLLHFHDLVTGYCRISVDSPYVNLTRGPLRLAGQSANWGDYDFYHIDEIAQFQQATFLSWFGGWALTGMRRKIWLDFPFRVNRYTRAQSDFESSWLLNRPFVTHREAYIEHLKPTADGMCTENILVGRESPRIIIKENIHA